MCNSTFCFDFLSCLTSVITVACNYKSDQPTNCFWSQYFIMAAEMKLEKNPNLIFNFWWRIHILLKIKKTIDKKENVKEKFWESLCLIFWLQFSIKWLKYLFPLIFLHFPTEQREWHLGYVLSGKYAYSITIILYFFIFCIFKEQSLQNVLRLFMYILNSWFYLCDYRNTYSSLNISFYIKIFINSKS